MVFGLVWSDAPLEITALVIPESSWWSRKRAATIALTALASFSLPAAPANAAPSDFLYVANHDDNNVSVIDTSTDTIVGTPITVGACHSDRHAPERHQGVCEQRGLATTCR